MEIDANDLKTNWVVTGWMAFTSCACLIYVMKRPVEKKKEVVRDVALKAFKIS